MTDTTPYPDSHVLLQACLETCNDRKAIDVAAYDLQGHSLLTDFYLLCSGNSDAHIKALADHLLARLKTFNILPRFIEGTADSHWLLIDCYDVVIHIFHPETRQHYNLEGLALLAPERRIYPEATASASETLPHP